MLPTKFRFIWPNGFRGEESKKSANQKQESPVVAKFVHESGRQQGVKYQLGYLILFLEGGLYKYPMKNILRTAKFFPNWGCRSKELSGPLTD